MREGSLMLVKCDYCDYKGYLDSMECMPCPVCHGTGKVEDNMEHTAIGSEVSEKHNKDELNKEKTNTKKYNVYRVDCKPFYDGIALISAESADKANVIIAKEQETDSGNKEDTHGWEFVLEEDKVENLFSDIEGVLVNCISYVY